MHGDYRVRVWHRTEAAALAAALGTTLRDEGFDAVIQPEPLTLPAGQDPPAAWINQLQFDAAADPRAGTMAEYITKRLSWLSWGTPVTQSNQVQVWGGLAAFAAPPQPRELRLLLATPGTTRARFRDALSRDLTGEELAAFAPQPVEPAPVPEQLDHGASDARPEDVDDSNARHTTEEAPETTDKTDEQSRLAGLDLLRAEIARLEAELKRLDAAMAAEERGHGPSGMPGRGPAWRALAEQRDTLARDLSRSRFELLLTGDNARGNQPLIIRDTLKDGSPAPEMIALPGGSFTMGSPGDEPARDSDEGPQREVRIAPFAIGRTEVTFDDYDRFAEATGRDKPYDRGWGRGKRPAINVSWDDAQAYAEWLSAQTGERYRLPTEAEWEYAARAGTETPFWTGDCIHTDQANYDGDYDYNDCGAKTGVYRAQTVPAGSLPANAFGLHEVAGNLYEWVEDCWHDGYAGAPTDGSAWLEADGGDCALRVLRGGSWVSSPWNLRAANRGRNFRDVRNVYVGFRLARTL